jgi:hypothetical protein
MMAVRLQKLFRPEVVLSAFVAAGAIMLNTMAPHTVYFESLGEFKEFAARNDFLLHPSGVGGFTDNLYVSDHPVSPDHLSALTKTSCGLNPAWRGIVWVHGHSWHSHVVPGSLTGKWRIWGNLLVAGDEGFMERLEERRRSELTSGHKGSF